MEKEQLELLKYLQGKYGEKEGLELFEKFNDFVMLTAKDVTKELRTEMALYNERVNSIAEKLRTEIHKSSASQTKWLVGIFVAILALLAAALFK